MKQIKYKRKTMLIVLISVVAVMLITVVSFAGCGRGSSSCSDNPSDTTPSNGGSVVRPPEPPEDLENFIPITSASEFNAISNNLTGDFRLAANINLTNHIPIGNSNEPFSGRFFVPFDDDGIPLYSITNLSITVAVRSGGSYLVALFGANDGFISNLKIDNFEVNIDVPNSDEARILVGAIAGDNRGIIEFVNVARSNVNINAHNGGIRAGIIAGRNRGENAVIRYTIANGRLSNNGVLGRSSRAGGIVGILEDGATIYRSGSNVAVSAVTTGNGNTSAGGLVGHIQRSGFVRESFAIGNVVAESRGGGTVYAGGLTGNINSEDYAMENDRPPNYRWNFAVEQSFATGSATARATGNAYVSGLIARIADNAGTAGDILISQSYSRGNSVIEAIGPMGSPNHYIGGLVGRIQSLEGSVISIENSFVIGNVTGSGVGSDNFAGALVGRFHNNGFREIENLFFSNQTTVNGTMHGLQGVPGSERPATEIAHDTLLTSAWQTANLGFNNSVWIFTDGQLPRFNWVM